MYFLCRIKNLYSLNPIRNIQLLQRTYQTRNIKLLIYSVSIATVLLLLLLIFCLEHQSMKGVSSSHVEKGDHVETHTASAVICIPMSQLHSPPGSCGTHPIPDLSFSPQHDHDLTLALNPNHCPP